MTARPDESETRYEDIFNNVATAILEEDISEVRKALADLKTQGIRDFKKYLDENPDFVLRAVQAVKVIDANDTALRLYGAKSRSELIASLDKIFTSESYEVFKHELVAMAEGRRYFEAEDININLQGEPLNIWLHAIMPSEESESGRRLTTIIDITERKKAEGRLSLQYNVVHILTESESIPETMHKILQTACKDIECEIGEIWFVDNKTNTLRLCSTWHKPEWEGSEFVEISKEFTFQKGKGLPGRVWESGQPAWITDVTADENFLRLSTAFKAGLHGAFAFPIKSSSNVNGIMAFYFRDIKPPDNDLLLMLSSLGSQIGGFISRRHVEEALRKSEQRYHNFVQQSKDAIFVVNLDSSISFASQACQDIFGYTPEEFMTDQELGVKIIHPDYRLQFTKFWEHYARTRKFPEHLSVWACIRKDNKTVYTENNFSNIYNEAGEVMGFQSIARDITERKRMEQELEKSHRLEAIGTLAGGIAHDFNNLLTAILGNIALTKMHMSLDNKDFARLTDAENACMQATELTKRIITFSKGGEPVRKPASISRIIYETTCSMLSGSNIACEGSLPEHLYPVYVDEGQIRQCFRNIAINAKEAMPDGGVIRIDAENVTIGEGEIIPLKKGNYVKVSVKDSGKGIPEDIIPKIFDPYFTTKEMGAQRGLGLGLAVCYSIIKKHEGHITVESKIGEGTTFHIYLPAAEAEIKRAIPEKTLPSEKKRVLVMDDEELVRDIAGQILEHLGYEVEYAKDGSEAIKAYKEAKESGKRFDGVILDLTVHNGMGGDMAIERLLSIDPEVRAIVSSGYADSPVMTDFRKHGFAGAIAKPYNVEQIKEILEKVLT